MRQGLLLEGFFREVFLFDTKKEPKKSPLLPIAREARPRGLRGCEQEATVERSETGERAMFAPAGRITARAGLRSKLAALVVRRQALAPKNPKEEVEKQKS